MSGISDWYVRHDGMPAMECYCKWCDNREAVERGGKPMHELTKAQIAEGRRLHNSLRGNSELVSTLLTRMYAIRSAEETTRKVLSILHQSGAI